MEKGQQVSLHEHDWIKGLYYYDCKVCTQETTEAAKILDFLEIPYTIDISKVLLETLLNKEKFEEIRKKLKLKEFW